VRFGAANGTVLISAAAFTSLQISPHLALAVLILVTVAWASVLPLGFASALGAVSWAYYTGFVVNSFGVLTFTGSDSVRLLVLLTLAVAAHWSR
jgi:hypothetical protein